MTQKKPVDLDLHCYKMYDRPGHYFLMVVPEKLTVKNLKPFIGTVGATYDYSYWFFY